jgi:hypothetical protein
MACYGDSFISLLPTTCNQLPYVISRRILVYRSCSLCSQVNFTITQLEMTKASEVEISTMQTISIYNFKKSCNQSVAIIRRLVTKPNEIYRTISSISFQKILSEGTQYRSRLYTHPNNLTVHLTVPPDSRRLRHLPTRFNE